MPKILLMTDPLDFNKHEIVDVPAGISIDELRSHDKIKEIIRPTEKVTVSRMGEVIPIENYQHDIVHANDYLMILPMCGDKKTLIIVASIGLMLVAGPAGQSLGANIAGAGATAGQIAFWSTIATVGIMVGGGMLISSMAGQPRKPAGLLTDPDANSQSHGWNPVTTQALLKIARVYGKILVEGNVTEGYRRLTGATTNTQILYTNIGIGEAPVDTPVLRDSLRLNDQRADNFDDVHYTARYGNMIQPTIGWLPDCTFEHTPFVEVTNTKGAKTVETKGNLFDRLKIIVSFPNGLYDGTGASLANHTVNVSVDVKKSFDSLWTSIATADITAASSDPVYREYDTDGLVTIPRGDKYEVRLTKNTADKNLATWGDGLYLDSIQEITEEKFSQPGLASVNLNVLATDNLSGTLRASWMTRGRPLRQNDGSWSIGYTNDMAWVVYDAFTQPILSGYHSPWKDLTLMLNFEGADADTDTLDESPFEHTITFGGTAQIDTDGYKFGSSSLLLDGNSDYLQISNDGRSFGIWQNLNDDWAIDSFVGLAPTGTEIIIGQYVDANNYWYLAHIAGAGFKLYVYVDSTAIVDISGVGEITSNVVAHWKLNDNLATQNVIDETGNHNGTCSVNTDTIDDTGKINGALNFGGTAYVTVTDNASFSFGDSSNDSAFSIAAWIYYDGTASTQSIISKYDITTAAEKREWWFMVRSTGQLRFLLGDNSVAVTPSRDSDNALTVGWHYVVATYDGTGGATALNGATLYVDNEEVNSTANNNAAYVAMEDTAANVKIGARVGTSGTEDQIWKDKLDNVVIFNKELSTAEIDELWNSGAGTEVFWNHIAVIKKGDEVGLYKDGAQIAYYLMTTDDSQVFADTDLYIGQNGNSANYLYGHFDHFRFCRNNLIFSASPVTGLTDTITKPAVVWSDPGNSYADAEHEGYADTKMDLTSWQAFSDWCSALKTNSNNTAIYSISKASNAVIVTTGDHKKYVGDTIVFRNVAANGMTEIPDETEATVVRVKDGTTLAVNIDSSAYTTYNPKMKLLYHFLGAGGAGSNILPGQSATWTWLGGSVDASYSNANLTIDKDESTYVGYYDESHTLESASGNYRVTVEFPNADKITEVEYVRYAYLQAGGTGYFKVYLYYGAAWNLIHTENISGLHTKASVKITTGGPWTDVTKLKIECYAYMNGSEQDLHQYVYQLKATGVYAGVDGDGDTATEDSSGRGHHAEATEFIGTAQIDTSQSKFDVSSLLLDGDSDYIQLADNEDWDILQNITNSVTVDFWVKHADHAGTETYLCQYEDASNWWSLHHEHGTGIVFANAVGGVTKLSISEIAGELTDTDWHHWAFIKVADDVGIYLDGTQVGYDLMVSGDIATFAGDLFIGAFGTPSNYFDGHIDELRITFENAFSATPNATPDDTITVPTSIHVSGDPVGTLEEKRIRFAYNGVIDTAGDNVWDTAKHICSLARGVPYMKGSKVAVAINKAASPSYMFNMSNVDAKSYKLNWLQKRERAYEITSQFRNQDDEYKRQSSPKSNVNIINTSNRITLDRFGLTDKQTVDDRALFDLLENQYINLGVQFRGDVDALPVKIGDVVYFAHDVANWAKIGKLSQHYTGSGQIKRAFNGSTAIITIDGQINFEDADWDGGSITYKITVKMSDDSLEAKTISGHTVVDGEHNILVTGPFTATPKPYDMWSAGQEDLNVKLFRVSDMRLTEILKADLLLTEYVEDCFQYD